MFILQKYLLEVQGRSQGETQGLGLVLTDSVIQVEEEKGKKKVDL